MGKEPRKKRISRREAERRIRDAVRGSESKIRGRVLADMLEEAAAEWQEAKERRRGRTSRQNRRGGAGRDAGVIPMIYGKDRRRRRERVAYVASMAAALLLTVALSWSWSRGWAEQRVAHVIQLDGVTSISVGVNGAGRVVEVRALDADAQAMVGGMDLRGATTEVAVNTVVGALYQSGYLDEEGAAILVSVATAPTVDPGRGESLQSEVVTDLGFSLGRYDIDASIISQTLPGGAAVTGQADGYGISEGKAVLVEKIAEVTEDYAMEELAQYTITELNGVLAAVQEDPDMDVADVHVTTASAAVAAAGNLVAAKDAVSSDGDGSSGELAEDGAGSADADGAAGNGAGAAPDGADDGSAGSGADSTGGDGAANGSADGAGSIGGDGAANGSADGAGSTGGDSALNAGGAAGTDDGSAGSGSDGADSIGADGAADGSAGSDVDDIGAADVADDGGADGIADGRAGRVSGNSVSGNSVSGNSVSGNGVSGNSVSGNSVSGNSVSGNSVSGNSISGNSH